MKINKVLMAFLLTFIVVATLLVLFFLPEINLGDNVLRRVNILSDVQRQESEEGEKIDSAALRLEMSAYVDVVPEGMTAIEDFADSTGAFREMDRFYAALDQADKRPVRVAYFGDSYIEGDILTSDLRELFQRKFGGCGVGFVEIACVSSGFRPTVATSRNGWGRYHANERGKGFNAALQGPAGSYFVPQSGAASFDMRLSATRDGVTDTAEVATVYFAPAPGLAISGSVNGEEAVTLLARGDSSAMSTDTLSAAPVEIRSVESLIGRFSMSVAGGASSRFYGVALDGKCGVAVDNYSMRGSGGHHLKDIPEETLRAFARVRPYDLIVLQFGLNVANAKQKDYSNYTRIFGTAVDHLKAAFPSASILIVSMGDRGSKGTDGAIHTMGGVRELVSFERKMASDHRVAFWNLYEAMGGDGSIARMRQNKQANLDYTHINFAGGRYLAGLLFDVLMNGKENHGNRVR